MEGVSQQLQFNHYCGLFITSFICACRDLNFRPQLCAVIKFRTNLKVAQLAHFSHMSRLNVVCSDISKFVGGQIIIRLRHPAFYPLLVNK